MPKPTKVQRTKVPRVDTQAEFAVLARKLGVRPDWHEPDEQEVDVRVRGTSFDNAGFWPHALSLGGPVERYVEIRKDGKPVAHVNLATLCSWAAGYREGN